MNDADRIEQQVGQPDETPHEAQRSLAGVLLSDINTVATTVVSAVAGTYAIKKVLSGGDDAPKGGGDQDASPPA